MCIHMTSKNISITKDVYNKLLKIKLENESFSELFLRLLKIQKNTLEKSFGAWDLKYRGYKMILLDTSACIDYLNGNIEIKKVIEEQDDLIHITSITIYEMNIGFERTKRKISEQRYKQLYKPWLEFISSMEIFALGFKEAEKAAKIYDVLESQGKTIDDNDILITGIMLANGIKKLITKNVRHFERIVDIELITY